MGISSKSNLLSGSVNFLKSLFDRSRYTSSCERAGNIHHNKPQGKKIATSNTYIYNTWSVNLLLIYKVKDIVIKSVNQQTRQLNTHAMKLIINVKKSRWDTTLHEVSFPMKTLTLFFSPGRAVFFLKHYKLTGFSSKAFSGRKWRPEEEMSRCWRAGRCGNSDVRAGKMECG